MLVNCFLVIFGKKHNPTRVPYSHGVLLVVPDINRSGYGPIGAGYHYWQAHAGNIKYNFSHQKQALGRGGRINPHAGSAGAFYNRGGGELAFRPDVLITGFSIGFKLSQIFHNMSLGSDRVG